MVYSSKSPLDFCPFMKKIMKLVVEWDNKTDLRSFLGYKQCKLIELGEHLVDLRKPLPIIVCKGWNFGL
jgi:hypothetical protein